MTITLRPAEIVLPGHPDKLCDAIADRLVQAATRREPRALVGVEVAVHRDQVFLTGRIGCEGAAEIDIEGIVRDVYRSAGHDAAHAPAPEQLEILSNLCLGPLEEGESEFREIADDQAICIGYANDLEATDQLPVEQWLARRLGRRLHALRLEQPELALGPDGKLLIVVREDAGPEGRRWALVCFGCALQQSRRSDELALHRSRVRRNRHDEEWFCEPRRREPTRRSARALRPRARFEDRSASFIPRHGAVVSRNRSYTLLLIAQALC